MIHSMARSTTNNVASAVTLETVPIMTILLNLWDEYKTTCDQKRSQHKKCLDGFEYLIIGQLVTLLFDADFRSFGTNFFYYFQQTVAYAIIDLSSNLVCEYKEEIKAAVYPAIGGYSGV